MHINDVYVLRDVLSAVKAGMRVEQQLVDALLAAATEEVEQFEKHLYDLAEREEAREMYS